MGPPSPRSIRLQQDREKSEDLLRIYGSLLTPKQYAMASGFVLEGKSFSIIAREHNISRQAVHEVVRSVQRLLNYYESNLGILKSGGPTVSVLRVREQLQDLQSQITGRGSNRETDWIVESLERIIRTTDGKPAGSTRASQDPAKMSHRSNRSAAGGARKRRVTS